MFKEIVEVVQNINLFEKAQNNREIKHFFFFLLEISSKDVMDVA